MEDLNYLIAVAFIEQNNKRAMPLGGKSLKSIITEGNDPGEFGEKIALELLLRILERSENGSINRVAKEKSLLLLEIPMEQMNEQIPLIKANWLGGGDLEKSISGLKNYSKNIWSVNFIKYEGVVFSLL